MEYSETVLRHFHDPHNVGDIDAPDACGEAENPICGDRIRMHFRIEHGIIRDVRWRGEGCVPTIAAASVLSELLRGVSLPEAVDIDAPALRDALGGIPARKSHAPTVAVEAAVRALRDYRVSSSQGARTRDQT